MVTTIWWTILVFFFSSSRHDFEERSAVVANACDEDDEMRSLRALGRVGIGIGAVLFFCEKRTTTTTRRGLVPSVVVVFWQRRNRHTGRLSRRRHARFDLRVSRADMPLVVPAVFRTPTPRRVLIVPSVSSSFPVQRDGFRRGVHPTRRYGRTSGDRREDRNIRR